MARTRHKALFVAIWVMLTLQACADISVQRMINADDHAGLARYYTQQAEELREEAQRWERTAESYERHSDPHGKTEPAQHARHCRTIARQYLQSAEEADELARQHRTLAR